MAPREALEEDSKPVASDYSTYPRHGRSIDQERMQSKDGCEHGGLKDTSEQNQYWKQKQSCEILS